MQPRQGRTWADNVASVLKHTLQRCALPDVERQQNIASSRRVGVGGAQELQCTSYMPIPSTGHARLAAAQSLC
ncbi:hypothetical protein KWI_0112370 [Xanthomonas vasicola pv. vasculorum NCPPB 206]|nr:hypothetical protein KWI_0112370 [Xanthomonas vasicola pv. vasculorum NCPPB 206]